MSALQEMVKPYLEPILENKSTTLHRKAQTAIASWVVMSIMVAEFLDKNMTAISDEERHQFFSDHVPKKHWRIWIGSHKRIDHPLWNHNVMTLIDPDADASIIGQLGDSNTQTSTFILGDHLLIHAMSSEIAQAIVRRWKIPKTTESAVLQIWPVIKPRINWPPKARLSEAGINVLAHQFYDRVYAQMMKDSRESKLNN